MNLNPATPHRMRSYIRHAQESAASLAKQFAERFDLGEAKTIYENIDECRVIGFEQLHKSHLYDFLELNEKHRREKFNLFTKFFTDEEVVLFFVLAIVGIARSMAMMELNDKFRWAAGPGRSYTVTIAGNYDFCNSAIALKTYDWPVRFLAVR